MPEGRIQGETRKAMFLDSVRTLCIKMDKFYHLIPVSSENEGDRLDNLKYPSKPQIV